MSLWVLQGMVRTYFFYQAQVSNKSEELKNAGTLSKKTFQSLQSYFPGFGSEIVIPSNLLYPHKILHELTSWGYALGRVILKIGIIFAAVHVGGALFLSAPIHLSLSSVVCCVVGPYLFDLGCLVLAESLAIVKARKLIPQQQA